MYKLENIFKIWNSQKMLHKKLTVIFWKYSVGHNSFPMKNHLDISDNFCKS